MESKKKTNTTRGVMLTTLFLKVINNERKVLTHHEIIDHIAEQFVEIIRFVDSSKLMAAKSTYRYMDFKKGILLKKVRNHSQSLKLQLII